MQRTHSLSRYADILGDTDYMATSFEWSVTDQPGLRLFQPATGTEAPPDGAADGTFLTIDQLLERGFDLDGTDGDDEIIGTNTTDRIAGLAGNDQILGLAGNDTITGGTGTDGMNGGLGDDIYRLSAGDGAVLTTADGTFVEQIAESVDGGGTDTLRFGAGVNPADIKLTGQSDGSLGGAGADSYVLKVGAGDTPIALAGRGNETCQCLGAQHRRSMTKVIGPPEQTLRQACNAKICGVESARQTDVIARKNKNKARSSLDVSRQKGEQRLNEASEPLARLRQPSCRVRIARVAAIRARGRRANRRITSADFYAANDATERRVA